MGEEQWYSNKDLFEQINELRHEMAQTRSIIKEYNGLRTTIHTVEKELADMKSKQVGKSKVATAIREWGGWIVALFAVIISLIKIFI